MQIFYIENENNNVLLININNKVVKKIVEQDNYVLLFNDDELVGINIFNIPDELNLKPGIIFGTTKILSWIQAQTKICLQQENHFVVCEVIECNGIDKTHLHKCIVTDGQTNYEIVCGAKNVRKGLKTVLAKVNTIMPNGKCILPGTLMGYKSNGMLCSYKELNLPHDQSGIVEIGSDYNVGDEFLPVYSN